MASAAILAGGRARRFGGADKSAVQVGGRPIFERQLDVLRMVATDLLLVGDRPTLYLPHDVRRIPDRIADCGPLGGLDAALAAATDDTLIVVACDMPFLTAPWLNALVAADPAADAVVPRTERGYHPLCAVYRRSCQPAVARHLAERRLKMVDLLNDLKVHVVEPEMVARYGGAELLANVNTPDELHHLQALLGHKL